MFWKWICRSLVLSPFPFTFAFQSTVFFPNANPASSSSDSLSYSSATLWIKTTGATDCRKSNNVRFFFIFIFTHFLELRTFIIVNVFYRVRFKLTEELPWSCTTSRQHHQAVLRFFLFLHCFDWGIHSGRNNYELKSYDIQEKTNYNK